MGGYKTGWSRPSKMSNTELYSSVYTELFFDHWLISTGPNQFKLNGKYEDFLKSHTEHFQSHKSETDD